MYFSQQDVEKADSTLIQMMDSRNLQEVVSLLIPDDPPTNEREYELARNVFTLRVLGCQPNAMEQYAPPQEAYRVLPPYITYPGSIILNWMRVAILGIALQDYKNALGSLLGLQETSCQFGDDMVLTSTAKLAFGVGAMVIPIKSEARTLYTAASMCQIPLEKKDEPCVAAHSWEARNLCKNFYEILVFFAVMNDGVETQPMNTMTRAGTHDYLANIADNIDKATKRKFRMREWVNTTVRRLGYDTGVK